MLSTSKLFTYKKFLIRERARDELRHRSTRPELFYRTVLLQISKNVQQKPCEVLKVNTAVGVSGIYRKPLKGCLFMKVTKKQVLRSLKKNLTNV